MVGAISTDLMVVERYHPVQLLPVMAREPVVSAVSPWQLGRHQAMARGVPREAAPELVDVEQPQVLGRHL